MIEWVKGLGWIIGPLIGWFLFRWLPDHPEYGEKILYKLLKLIPFTFSWKKRKTIEKEICAYITEEIKSVNSESYGFKILSKGIKIEWLLREKEEVIVGENEIIIRLGSRVNPCENFVDALILYISNSFIPTENIYLDPTLFEACKFQIVISMLRKRTSEYYKLFIDKYYKPALEKYREILDYSDKLQAIEKSGLFTTVFIPTLSFYTDMWISQRKSPSTEIHKDIIGFLDFINNIATKKEYEEEMGEEPPLTYLSKYLKICVILVARKELAEKSVYIPHFESARHELKHKVYILFVTGRGRNADLAKHVASKLKKEQFCEQIGEVSKFENCICYAFKRKI